MLNDIKKSLLTPALLMLAGAAWAIPAKPGLVTITQADGTQLVVSRQGDEFGHYVLSEDGHLLLEGSDNLLYYAVQGTDGKPVASSVAATNVSLRSAQAVSLLSQVNDDQLISMARAKMSDAIVAKRDELSQRMATPANMQRVAEQKIPSSMLFTNFPSKGKQKAMVILVEYQDVPFTLDDPHQYFNDMLNKEGFSDYNGTGCAHDYFMECSDGQFDPEFDVYGPILLAHERAYYGKNRANGAGQDTRPWEMIIEACQQLDATVDFTQYDRDGDGKIDNIFCFYAGQGEASYGPAESIWPHSYNIYTGGQGYRFDGMILDRYACANEWTSNRPDGVGTFIHEFSHVMGLPDLYDPAYNPACYTPGKWDVLDQGPYNNGGCTPPMYGVFHRMSLGWLTPRKIDRAMNVSLLPIDSNVAYYMETGTDNEFYLYENRQKNSWDTYLPGHGMLVWHIDYDPQYWKNNSVNSTPSHQRVDLVEADGVKKSGTSAIASPSDPFPGTKKKSSFTATTSPALKAWNGTAIDLPITGIAETDKMITFKVLGGVDPIEATTALEPTNVEGTTFTANWAASADAESYLLVVNEENVSHPVVNHVNVGNVTSYDVTGLQPNTTYTYKVVVIGSNADSEYSNVITFTTGDPTLGDIALVATDATEVEDNAFVANWVADNRADSYYLALQQTVPATTYTVVADFNGSALPEGWTTSATSFESTEKYVGESAPALVLDTQDGYVETADYWQGISSCTFHITAMATSAVFNSVKVLCKVNGQWAEADGANSFYPSTTGKDCEATIPEGTTAIKIMLNRKKDANVAIDDIVISGGQAAYRIPVEGRQHIEAGSGSSFRVDGLNAGTEYAYTVYGVDSRHTSLPSNLVVVKTTGTIGIADLDATDNVIINAAHGTINIAGTDAVAEVYNMQGRLTYRGLSRNIAVAPGLYIVRVSRSVAKVMVK